MKKFKRVQKEADHQVSSAPGEAEIMLHEPARKIVHHFSGGTEADLSQEEKAIQELKKLFENSPHADPKDQLDKLSYTELCEELLQQYHHANLEAKRWQEIRESLRGEILRLAGQERGTFQIGSHILSIQERGSSVSFDWRQYIEDEVGRESLIEIENNLSLARDGKQTWKYAKLGKPSVVIDVSKSKNSGGAPAVKAPEAR